MKSDNTYAVTLDSFTVEVTRKPIHSLRLRVLPGGRVRLSTPANYSRFAAEEFLWGRRQWIEAQLRAQAETAPRENSDTLLLFGRAYPLSVHRGAAFSLSLESDCALLTCPADASAEKRDAFLQRWYRTALEREIRARLPVWEEKTGLHATAFQIRSMKSRWGSCTVKTGRIRFALQLVHYPLPCLDYVILHELCHLAVPNHSPAFYALLSRYMPEWKTQKNRLRQIGAE